MRRPVQIVVALLVFAGIALIAGLMPFERKSPENLLITTGTQDSPYMRVGKQLSRVLEEYQRQAIGKVNWIRSDGTVQNIGRLDTTGANLALVFGPVFASKPRGHRIHALMALYTDILQVVVRNDASITGLNDLKGKRISVGADGSGTTWVATRVLDTAAITETDYHRVTVKSFDEAASKLRSGKADAAFFLAGTQAPAVTQALASGCCALLDLWNQVGEAMEAIPGLEQAVIHADDYENQPLPVQTLGARALLVGRQDLGDEVVFEILDAIFDKIGGAALKGTRLQDIRLDERAFELPRGVKLHSGARRFRDQEKRSLLIATGTIGGKYYQLGKRIQRMLSLNKIPARTIQTDGAVENLQLLASTTRPTLAITQYDTALASAWGEEIYQTELPLNIPQVKGLRRIATLHEEKVHVLMRSDRISNDTQGRPTLAALDGKVVCLGPKNSGTEIIARVLLDHYGIKPRRALHLSVPDMVKQIDSGQIDAGFFVSHTPSALLKTVVRDDRNRLLAIDPRKIAGLLGHALFVAKIEPGTYGAQGPGQPAIDTVATRAVLVVKEDLLDVEEITRVLFEGAGYLGVEGGAKAMAGDLDSLPLHPGAKTYYQKKGLLPLPPSFAKRIVTWLQSSWYMATIIVILIGAISALLKYRRDRTGNEFGRRILAVSIGAADPRSADKLMEIRNEIRECVRRRWWQLRKLELDRERWRKLYDLINDRIAESRENMTQALAKEAYAIAIDTDLGNNERHERMRMFEERVSEHFESGDIDASQLRLLHEMIRETALPPSETT